jgi:hypothetical protein
VRSTLESSITIDRLKTRVIVHKGATISTGQYSNERFDYTIDSEVPAEALPKALNDVDIMIDERVRKQKAAITAHPVNNRQATSETPNQPPWKKLPSNTGEWIYADQKGLEELFKTLQNSKNHTCQDTEYAYRLSKDQRFIQRFPKKPHRERLNQ